MEYDRQMKATILKANSRLLKVLGHSKRLEIACLLQGHSLTVNQIVQMSALRQAAVSQHLMILKAAKLLISKKLGKEIYYSLNKQAIEDISGFLHLLTRIHPIEDLEPTVIDPVCLMHLTPSSASYTTEYDGVRHYFCGKGCLKEFSGLHKGAL